jgi:2-isopropylmalate synthase
MDVDQKIDFFRVLVDIGYKEIEIAFPCASQTELDFTRYLVETPSEVPDDVWIQVMSPCREDLIAPTIAAVRGAKKAIMHIYVATSPSFLNTVLHMSEDETIALAVTCVTLVRSLTKDYNAVLNQGTSWTLQFSLEAFQDTTPEFAVRICEAVKAVWEPSEDIPIIFTLAATVESSTPNIFADLVEYFCTHMSEREKVCVSVHPHNDRGTAVAAAEQGQLAGADRVEGCLFGNGERTGNVDLVTLALNLYTQGISPNVDFSNLREIVRFSEDQSKIAIHPRLPYAGKLVYCTFAGSHQDAIKKGFDARAAEGMLSDSRWDVPYIPIDPGDLGRAHEALIRITSQSGKGGGAWLMQQSLGLDMPRGLQIAFAKLIKTRADEVGAELLEPEVVALFKTEFFREGKKQRFHLLDCHVKEELSSPFMDNGVELPKKTSSALALFEGVVTLGGIQEPLCGRGADTVASIVDALTSLGIYLSVREVTHQTIRHQQEAQSVSIIEATMDGKAYRWGAATHKIKLRSIVLAVSCFTCPNAA